MHSDLLNRVDSALKELRENNKTKTIGAYEHYALKFIEEAVNFNSYKKNKKNKKIEIRNLNELNKLSSIKIADAIKLGSSLETERHKQFEDIWNSNIAPDYLIQKDFSGLINENIMYTSHESKIYAWVLAITGHAANGHSVFNNERKKRFPNTTVKDILKALAKHPDISKFVDDGLIPNKDYFNPEILRKEVQSHGPDNLVRIIENYFNGPPEQKFYTIKKGKNFGGLIFNSDYTIDMLEFLRGYYFSGWMDVGSLREKAALKYKRMMGYGDTVAGNLSEVKKYFCSLEELSKKEYEHSKFFSLLDHKKMIEVFKRLGIVADIDEPDFYGLEKKQGRKVTWDLIKEKYGLDINGEWENIYIREKKGKGISDDIAVTNAGFLPDSFRTNNYVPGKSAVLSKIIGAEIGDRTDTHEKISSPVFNNGQDSTIAQYFNYLFKNKCKSGKYKKFNHIRDDLEEYNLINTSLMRDCCIISSNINYIIHSSMRHFGREQQGTCMTEQIFIFVSELLEDFKKNPTKINRLYSNSEIPCDLLHSSIPVKIKVGFHKVPINKYKERVRESLGILLDPSNREKNITDYFANLK